MRRRSLALLLWAVLSGTLYAQVKVPGGTFSGGAVTGATSFLDGANFQIKNTSDPTKVLQFDVSGVTMSNTVTPFVFGGTSAAPSVTMANSSNFLVPFGAAVNLGALGNANSAISCRTENTPDTCVLAVGSTSNTWHVAQTSSLGADRQNGSCGTAACTDPAWVVFSHNGTATEYLQGSSFGLQSQQAKTLTESSATAVVQVAIASGSFTGGTIEYTVVASDGTDHQSRHGKTTFQGVNKAGTETCTISPTAETADGSSIAATLGTLTYTWAADTAPTNGCNFTLNAVSSLAQTTLRIYYTVIQDGPGALTPQ